MSSSEQDSPLRFDLEVPNDGRIELQVPIRAGTAVSVYVIEKPSEFGDLMDAAATSTDFWDNPEDDEDWNNA
jgi:hypothetical protein